MSNRIWLGLAFIVIGLFGNQILEVLAQPVSPKVDIELTSPMTDKTEQLVKPVADKVTELDDRTRLAIFNDVFSKRITSYDCDAQQMGDVYIKATENVFDGSLKDKYDGYGDGIVSIFKSTVGTDNHRLNEIEKVEVSKNFNALAYSLSL
tara:strand:+ start:2969 stop:3418 length:450 start_codon:yes stop_codon:yes gene_type:complete